MHSGAQQQNHGAELPGSGSFEVGTLPVRRVAMLKNPAAGKGGAGDRALNAAQQLNRRGVDVLAIQGKDAAGARELAREMIADESIDALVVAGGDGLISLALQEQAESGKPLGIIPAGTGNDHAREFGIPLDPVKAANVIADGFWATSDLGRMHRLAPGADLTAVDAPRLDPSQAADPAEVSKWFGTIACNGFDSLVTDRTNAISWPKGRMRYNLAILLEFLNFHSIPMRLVLDPGEGPGGQPKQVIEENATLVAIGNTRTYCGGMYVCPDADHHDGVLEVTLLGRMSRARAVWSFSRIFTGEIDGVAGVSQLRAKRVRIDMPDMNTYADGEKFAQLPMEIEVVPGAGRFLVPRP